MINLKWMFSMRVYICEYTCIYELKCEITELKYASLIKNYHSRRKFQMALKGFCI